jgi:hypothetical protein
MPPVGFELAIPASKLPQTNALDCEATGIGRISWIWKDNIKIGLGKW